MDFSTDMTTYHPDPSIAPLTIQQLRNIYQQQLDHQRQETQAAQAQVTLLTQQLDNETASRQLLHVRENFVCVLFVCLLFFTEYRLLGYARAQAVNYTDKTGARRKDNKRPLAPPRLARFTFQIFFRACSTTSSLKFICSSLNCHSSKFIL